MDLDSKAVGARVKKARKAMGMTLGQLAALTGMSEPTLSRIENGVGRLRIERLDGLARALGKPTSYFLSGGTRQVREAPTVRIRPPLAKKASCS